MIGESDPRCEGCCNFWAVGVDFSPRKYRGSRTLNLRGMQTRQGGAPNTAIGLFQQAMLADPDFVAPVANLASPAGP